MSYATGSRNGNYKHGLKRSQPRLFRIWSEMKSRCGNPKDKNYPNYGGRGIQVCQEWLDVAIFVNWALENRYSDTLTIDRKDNNLGYNPENCRWATVSEQQNNKRNTILVEIDGITDTLAGWSKRTGLKLRMLQDRYHSGFRNNELIQPVMRKRSVAKELNGS